jgi:hypothetical protein
MEHVKCGKTEQKEVSSVGDRKGSPLPTTQRKAFMHGIPEMEPFGRLCRSVLKCLYR